MTSGEPERQIVSHPAVLRSVEVLDVDELGPHASRVQLTGDQLGAFERDGLSFPAFSSPGPEDHVRFVLPAAAGEPVVLPEQRADRLIWPRDPEATRRDVSVRHFDPDTAVLTVEVVRHGGNGPLAGWAERVRPGDRVHLSGPRSSRLMPTASHFVLVGDLASLAAIARWTREAPETSTVTVLAAVPGPDDQRPVVRDGPGLLDLRWLHGDLDRLLPEALGQVVLGDDPFVFVGAENDIARQARELLRSRYGLGPRQFRCIGYWRR